MEGGVTLSHFTTTAEDKINKSTTLQKNLRVALVKATYGGHW